MAHPEPVTDSDFKEKVIDSSTPVLVDFWADWCGPCKMLSPTIDAIAEKYDGKIKVGKVNVDNDPGLAQKYGVRGIPTMMIFKDGRLIDQKVGSLPKSIINKWIESNLGV